MIRPRGVVSKNDIGEWRILVSILLWIVLDPLMVANTKKRKAKMAENT